MTELVDEDIKMVTTVPYIQECRKKSVKEIHGSLEQNVQR